MHPTLRQAIVISVIGTICKAIEDVYNYRQRGQVRVAYSDQINQLCHDFVGLTGTHFNPNHEEDDQKSWNGLVIPDLSKIPTEVLQVYMSSQRKPPPSTHVELFKKFQTESAHLQTECRAAAFIGQTAAGATGAK